MSIDAKVMTVVAAIKQSLQMSGSPGSSVNTHPNPFFINVQGEVNLKHAAELVIQRLGEYDVHRALQIAREAREEAAEERAKVDTGGKV